MRFSCDLLALVALCIVTLGSGVVCSLVIGWLAAWLLPENTQSEEELMPAPEPKSELQIELNPNRKRGGFLSFTEPICDWRVKGEWVDDRIHCVHAFISAWKGACRDANP